MTYALAHKESNAPEFSYQVESFTRKLYTYYMSSFVVWKTQIVLISVDSVASNGHLELKMSTRFNQRSLI